MIFFSHKNFLKMFFKSMSQKVFVNFFYISGKPSASQLVVLIHTIDHVCKKDTRSSNLISSMVVSTVRLLTTTITHTPITRHITLEIRRNIYVSTISQYASCCLLSWRAILKNKQVLSQIYHMHGLGIVCDASSFAVL